MDISNYQICEIKITEETTVVVTQGFASYK